MYTRGVHLMWLAIVVFVALLILWVVVPHVLMNKRR
jgi:hypothetical protein